MFIHNFKYAFKILFKNKPLIFWTFIFPIVLGTLFNMAFSNIENSEKMKVIDIAIVDNDDFKCNEVFKSSFKELSDKNNKDRLFNTKYTTYENAKKLLEDNKVVGYLIINNNTEPKLYFSQNGIDQTVFKYVTEEIWQTSDLFFNLTKEKIQKEMISGSYQIDYNKIYSEVEKIINENNVKIKNISNKKLSYTMIEFYTLIAMACLYGGMLSMTSINQSLANMSNKGKRISISPTKKSIVVISSLLASYVTQLIGIGLLFIYTIFVIKVDYGDNLLFTILLALIGSFAGLSIGTFVGTIFKKNENSKIGMLIAFTMLESFFSGMMGITLKYYIDKNTPIINKINPAAMITDGYYALYSNLFDRYWFNIFSLLIFSIILILISSKGLRRQKYDSI